jgi:hypothetical protein
MWSNLHSITVWLQVLFPHDMLDEILNHTLTVAKRGNLVSFVNYASDLFQVEVSHLYNPKTLEFMLIVYIPLVSNANLLELGGPSQ